MQLYHKAWKTFGGHVREDHDSIAQGIGAGKVSGISGMGYPWAFLRYGGGGGRFMFPNLLHMDSRSNI